MSIWSLLYKVLDSDFGYDLGRAIRKAVVEGINRPEDDDDDVPKRETPEEAFDKLARDNADSFGSSFEDLGS